MVQAPSIPHFKGLGMRNLQYEISIYQKINNKATMTMSSYLIFSDSHVRSFLPSVPYTYHEENSN